MDIQKVILNRLKSDFKGEIEYVESEGVYVKYKDGKALIGNHSKSEMARGLCLLAKGIKEGKEEFEISEKPAFERRGIKVDMSRGGVMRVSEIKVYLEYLACMGLNTFMMLMEDVYKLEEYPYFGYMRGAYSKEELKEIDDYAFELGIEVIPHIQTLGHMEQYLKWPAAAPVKCHEKVLLCDEEKTYELIECMLKTLRESFRSNKIYIGCDEAYGLELGNYLKKHGYQNSMEVLLKHLNRVVEMCKKYNLEPMMASDFFFRQCAPKKPYNVHYDLDTQITDEIIKIVPDVDLCIWEYTRVGAEEHSQIMEMHKKLGRKVWFTGGFVGWFTLMPAYNKFMMSSVKDSLFGALHSGVSNVCLNTFGNDGNECNVYYYLFAFTVLSEICYKGEAFEDKDFYDMSRFLFGVHEEFFDASAELSLPEFFINGQPTRFDHEMCGKALFYADIMYNLTGRIEFYRDAKSRYEHSAKVISESFDNEEWADYRDFGVVLYEILGKKADIIVRIREEYKKGNKEYLKNLAEREIPALIKDYEKMHKLWKKMWLKTYKPFGLESISGRLAHVIIRLEYLIERIEEYLSGSISTIEELDVEILEDKNLALRGTRSQNVMHTGTLS